MPTRSKINLVELRCWQFKTIQRKHLYLTVVYGLQALFFSFKSKPVTSCDFKGCYTAMRCLENVAAGWLPHKIHGGKGLAWPVTCQLLWAAHGTQGRRRVVTGKCCNVGPSFLGRALPNQDYRGSLPLCHGSHICCRVTSLHSIVPPNAFQMYKKIRG